MGLGGIATTRPKGGGPAARIAASYLGSGYKGACFFKDLERHRRKGATLLSRYRRIGYLPPNPLTKSPQTPPYNASCSNHCPNHH